MFGKKKDKKEKKDATVQKAASGTTSFESHSSSTSIQQSTTTVTNVIRETSSTSASTSHGQLDWNQFPRPRIGLNTSEFQQRLSSRSLGNGETRSKVTLPKPLSFPSLATTDAGRYAPQPPRSAFSSLTLSSYSGKSDASVPRKTSLPPTAMKPPVDSRPFPLVTSNPESSRKAISELGNKVKVKVKKSTKFYDNDTTVIPTYKTSSKNRGTCLVMNNVVFENKDIHRAGAEVDDENITELLKQMGFKVNKHRDKNKKQMETIIENYRKDKGLSKYDINVVVIMSHGNGGSDNSSTQIETADHQMISTTWIIQQFDGVNCPSLANKPKIFIFQCCRGDQRDVAVDALQVKPPIVRKPADMLMAYSTIPGYVSHRDPKLGTWYIQAICKVFMEHAHDTDVENLLKIVDSQLANIPSTGRQTSSYENRGFKRCFLHPT